MRIDWGRAEKAWRILRLDQEIVVDTAKRITILCPCELVLTENGNHGYLVTAGTAEKQGDSIVIR